MNGRLLEEEHAMSKHSKHKAQSTWSNGQSAVAVAEKAPPVVTEEQIRRRAYQLYLAHGQKTSDPVKDWLQAERELKAELGRH